MAGFSYRTLRKSSAKPWPSCGRDPHFEEPASGPRGVATAMERGRAHGGVLRGDRRRPDRAAVTAVVLTYHAVEDGPAPLCVEPELFRAQLDCLVDVGAETLTISALAACLRDGSLPARAVAITFDATVARASCGRPRRCSPSAADGDGLLCRRSSRRPERLADAAGRDAVARACRPRRARRAAPGRDRDRRPRRRARAARHRRCGDGGA